MGWLDPLMHDAQAAAAIALIGVLVVLSLLASWWQRRSALTQVIEFGRTFGTRCEAWKEGTVEKRNGSIWEAASEQFLFRSNEGRIVVRTTPATAVRPHVRDLLWRKLPGGFLRLVGENLTAIALVLTFVLLGVVLVDSVVEALGTKGDGQSTALSEAVGKMGAKFFVSAAGLLGSVFVSFFLSQAQRRIDQQFDELGPVLAQFTEELMVHQARCAARTEASINALHTDLRTRADDWTLQLKKLESISVTVSGIGEEVTTHFGQFIKANVADRICDAVVDLQERAANVADSMQRQLAMSFSSSLTSEISRLESGLSAVQTAVEGQAQADIERLMDKLADTVTGGFKSESNDMAAQLARFSEVLPKLEHQFESMATALTANTDRYGEQNQRAIDALTSRIGDLLSQFEAAKTGMHGAVEQIAAAGSVAAAKVTDAATNQIDGLTQALVRSAQSWGEQNQTVLAQIGDRIGGLLEKVDATRGAMDGTVERLANVSADITFKVGQAADGHTKVVAAQLESMRRVASDGANSIHERSAAFEGAMANAQSHLVASTKTLNDTVLKMVGAIRDAAAAQEQTQSSLTLFGSAARQIAEAAKRVDVAALKQASVIEREEQLIAAQRVAVDSLENVLGGVLKTYEQGIARQSQLLSAEWEKLATNAQRIVAGASDGFADSIEELGSTVKDLKEALVPLKRARP